MDPRVWVMIKKMHNGTKHACAFSIETHQDQFIFLRFCLRCSQSEEHPKTSFSLNDDIFVEKYHKISGFRYKGMYWHSPKIKKLLKRKEFVTQYSFMGVWPFDNFGKRQIVADKIHDAKKWKEKLPISETNKFWSDLFHTWLSLKSSNF